MSAAPQGPGRPRPDGSARLAAALLALAAGLATACEPLEVPSTSTPEPACREDDHCDGAWNCRFGVCVAPGTNRLSMSARIIPRGHEDLLHQQVPELDLREGIDRRITLLEPDVLVGRIRHAGAPDPAAVSGRVSARNGGDVPGLDYRFSTKVNAPDEAGRGGSAGALYELPLLPGRPYQMTFRPDDERLPSHRFQLPGEATDAEPHTIRLPRRCTETQDADASCTTDASRRVPPCCDEGATPGPSACCYQRVAGVVRFEGSSHQPIPAARVTPRLPDGRGMVPRQTDSNGGFDFLLPPAADEVRFEVRAPEGGPVFPRFESAPLETGTELWVGVPTPPQDLEPFEARVQVRTPVALGTPVGLDVVALGHLSGGTLRRVATTDEDGIARFQALPGAYELMVSVPPELPFAGRVVWRDLEASADGERDAPTTVVELRARPRVDGRIRDSRGNPVQAGTVTAMRRGPIESGDGKLRLAPSPFEAPLAEGGRFELLVDPGRYDFRIQPEQATGAPAHLLRGKQVTEDVEPTIDLPPPGLAHITVAGPDGTPLPDATVELYVSGSASSDDAPPHLLTKGTTGPDGFVDLLVPFRE